MENNPELQLAWQFIENTGTHLFLTISKTIERAYPQTHGRIGSDGYCSN